jgi:hypothetical protein
MRMGKGVGKLAMWFVSLAPGTVIIEFKHLRLGRLAYFTAQLRHKFNAPSVKLVTLSKSIKFQKLKKVNIISAPFLN